MKNILARALVTFAFLGWAHADLPAPRPNDFPAPKPITITVSNLTAFPRYQFYYRSADEKGDQRVVDGRPFTAYSIVKLVIQSGEEPRQVWETVPYERRGGKVAMKVEGVKQEGKQIAVTYKVTSGDLTPGKKSPASSGPLLPLLMLSGISVGGLVVIGRRRRN